MMINYEQGSIYLEVDYRAYSRVLFRYSSAVLRKPMTNLIQDI
jgi:hypothetical protein